VLEAIWCEPAAYKRSSGAFVLMTGRADLRFRDVGVEFDAVFGVGGWAAGSRDRVLLDPVLMAGTQNAAHGADLGAATSSIHLRRVRFGASLGTAMFLGDFACAVSVCVASVVRTALFMPGHAGICRAQPRLNCASADGGV